MTHEEKVARLASQIARHRNGAPLVLHKRSVSHEVPKSRWDKAATSATIDLSDLDDVLSIDPVERTCVAEPGVTFCDLVERTLRYDLVPLVVPELKTITIGGAVSGCSLESTSFRFGGFHDTCLEYEVLTAKGERLVCTPDNENKLVFQMVHGTFGTLAIITWLKFRLLPAKPYVKIVYETHRDLEAYKAAIWRHFERRDVDFMDGIIHSPDKLVLSVGEFVDAAPYTHRYDWVRVYYRSTARRRDDYLRTPDYFFRYDHGVTNVHPKSFVGRLLLGRFLGSAQLLRLAERFDWLLPRRRPRVTVDVFVPFSKLTEFFDWYVAEVDHFPLWCVPYRRMRDYEWLSPRVLAATRDPLFIDLAIYGMKQAPGRNTYRLIEEELARIGGVKSLISHNYYSRDEFWQTWNKDTYDRVKARTDPDNALCDLYDKTCPARR